MADEDARVLPSNLRPSPTACICVLRSRWVAHFEVRHGQLQVGAPTPIISQAKASADISQMAMQLFSLAR